QLLEQARHLVARWRDRCPRRLADRLAARDRAGQLVDLALQLALAVGDGAAQASHRLVDRRGDVGRADAAGDRALLHWHVLGRDPDGGIALAEACATAATAAATATSQVRLRVSGGVERRGERRAAGAM